MRALVLVVAFLATACGGPANQYQTQLTPAGQAVQVRESGQVQPSCEFKGTVEARNLNPGISEFLYNELRNKAAGLGGNTVTVQSQNGAYGTGRVYVCPSGGQPT